jgi:hypothetical protein
VLLGEVGHVEIKHRAGAWKRASWEIRQGFLERLRVNGALQDTDKVLAALLNVHLDPCQEDATPALKQPPAGWIIADFGVELRHTSSMGSEPLKLQEKLAAEYHARWEAVETVKAQELAALTEERAREMIHALRPFVPTPPKPLNGMGLVEQQAIFHKQRWP